MRSSARPSRSLNLQSAMTTVDSHHTMKGLTSVTLPTIHLNGTDAADLEAQYRAVRHVISMAIQTLGHATCNARDFYPQAPGAWQRAQDERAEAFRLLQLVSNYVEQWENHAADARRARARA